MRQYLKRKLKQLENKLLPRGLVLLYHRVSQAGNDPWDLVVSPEHFTQQLEVLQRYTKVVSLHTLAEKVFNNTLKGQAAAITFDDGYRDNYYNARPRLQALGLPATFFVVSGTIGSGKEFWWDDLERLLLTPGQLPEVFQSSDYPDLNGYSLQESALMSSDDYENYKDWKAWEKPPTSRHALYLELWKRIKPVEYATQTERIDEIARWAGKAMDYREDYRPMSKEELVQLGQQSLFDLEAHTLYHAQLSAQSRKVQTSEVLGGADLLREITNKKSFCFSYPYGDLNGETLDVVKKTGFSYAFTTEEKVFNRNADLWAIPRFQVKNWSGKKFEERLLQWIKQF